MCGRYTLTYSDLDEVAAAVGAVVDPSIAKSHRPRYNIAPSTACIIARPFSTSDKPVLVRAQWGLEMNGRLVFNVRAETAERRFPSALARRRCVIPADGFYEWTGEREDRRPLWFHRPDGGLLLMAGIFDERPNATPTFAVLTTAARPPVSEIHLRMPLLFSPDGAAQWIALPPLGPPQPDAIPLAALAVSHRVNSVENDDPSCLEPGPPTAQLGLF